MNNKFTYYSTELGTVLFVFSLTISSQTLFSELLISTPTGLLHCGYLIDFNIVNLSLSAFHYPRHIFFLFFLKKKISPELTTANLPLFAEEDWP